MITKRKIVIVYTVMVPLMFVLTFVASALTGLTENHALAVSVAYTLGFSSYFTYLNWGSVKELILNLFNKGGS